MKTELSDVLVIGGNKIVKLPISDKAIIERGVIYHHLTANMPAINSTDYEALAEQMEIPQTDEDNNYNALIKRLEASVERIGCRDVPYRAVRQAYQKMVGQGVSIDKIMAGSDEILTNQTRRQVISGLLPNRVVELSRTKALKVDYNLLGAERDNWQILSTALIEFDLRIDDVGMSFLVDKNYTHEGDESYNLVCKNETDGAVNGLLAHYMSTNKPSSTKKPSSDAIKLFISKYEKETEIRLTEEEVEEYAILLTVVSGIAINRYVASLPDQFLYQVEDTVNGGVVVKNYDQLDYIELVWSIGEKSNLVNYPLIAPNKKSSSSQAKIEVASDACRKRDALMNYEMSRLEASYEYLAMRLHHLESVRHQSKASDNILEIIDQCKKECRYVDTELTYIRTNSMKAKDQQIAYNVLLIAILEDKVCAHTEESA